MDIKNKIIRINKQNYIIFLDGDIVSFYITNLEENIDFYTKEQFLSKIFSHKNSIILFTYDPTYDIIQLNYIWNNKPYTIKIDDIVNMSIKDNNFSLEGIKFGNLIPYRDYVALPPK